MSSSRKNNKSHVKSVFHGLRKPLLVSLAMFLGVTLILATVLLISERRSGNVFLGNWWDSLGWLLTYYIDAPGRLDDFHPISTAGNIVTFLAGIVKLLIFAVLTGYFITLLREWLRTIHLKECEKRIINLFKRRKCRGFPKKVVRPYEPLESIMARLNLKEEDIIDSVMASSALRLRNLADGELRKDHPNDRLVVERIPYMNKDYGCRVNRESCVTIVCPTALSEPGIGNFSWYVAQFGRFNYVSREVRLPGEEDISYYGIKKEDEQKCPVRKTFLKDINDLACYDKSWTIILIAGMDSNDSYYYVHDGTSSGLSSLKNAIDNELRSLGVHYKPGGKKSKPDNLERVLEHPSRTMTIRISYNTMLWKDNRISVAYAMARAISSVLTGQPIITDEWLSEEGEGYQYEDKPLK